MIDRPARFALPRDWPPRRRRHGVVYEAQDERLPRLVALTVLSERLADDPDAVRRLSREADTLARLNHPNICTIFEVDEHQGRLFLVMERLEGTDLKFEIARRTFFGKCATNCQRKAA